MTLKSRNRPTHRAATGVQTDAASVQADPVHILQDRLTGIERGQRAVVIMSKVSRSALASWTMSTWCAAVVR
jgi:hypothetical protein